MRSSDVSFDSLMPFLNLLPPREVDLLEMYFRLRKNQKDIAKMYGVTQGAVSSRISRARKRIEFLTKMPKVTERELDEALGGIFDSIELEIIKCMMMTTCQSKTAEIINERFGLRGEKDRMTQVKVRHRFEKCLNYLENLMEIKPSMLKYYELLKFIKNNLYMLHEVKLPHFDRGKVAVFSMSL
jgi:predicted transcriptional regulator